MQYELRVRWVNGANMRRFRARELRGPADIAQIARRLLGTSGRFCVLHIDHRGRVVGYSEAAHRAKTRGKPPLGFGGGAPKYNEYARGGGRKLDGCAVDARVVFRSALDFGAEAVIVAHCHRSDPTPNRADLEVTKGLRARGELVGVQLLDHVIVADGECASLLERGLLE